jgi:DNA polymerase-1
MDGGEDAAEGGIEADLDAETETGPSQQSASGQAARSRGRFTRNFVIQASAADWAAVWLAVLRRRLAELGGPTGADPAAAPHLVFFVHDEVVVHTPKPLAESAAQAVAAAADEARRVVFGPTPVRFPLATAVVDCYADAK